MTMVRLPNCCAGVLAVALLLCLSKPVWADETKGTVRAVNVEKHELVVKGVASDTTYHLTKEAWVILDGRRVKLQDLKEGDKVTMNTRKENNQYIAAGVRAFRIATSTTGTISTVNTTNNVLVLKGTVKDTTYIVDKNVAVYMNGKQCNFSDLRPDDSVDITYFRNEGDQLAITEIRASRK